MRSSWTSIVCAMAIAAVTPASAHRQKPDFTGTWIATPEAPKGLDAAPSAILGARLGLRHDRDRLVVTRPIQDDVSSATFTLDSARVSYRVPGRLCEGDREITETASWDGDAVVLAIVQQVPPGGGTPLTLNARRLLHRDGDSLVVEGTITQAGTTRRVGTIYKRSADPMPGPKPAVVTGTPATIAQAGWIAGTWIGTSGTVTTEERWTPSASGGMLAVARTLRGAQMSSFEFLCISERAGSLVYTAMPDGRTTPTFFTLTAVAADSATFENPAHDYPKLIRYSLKSDGTLETTIAGAAGARPQSVLLKRQQ